MIFAVGKEKLLANRIFFAVQLYLLASSHALSACGEVFFFLEKKILYFYFENIIYKCFFLEKKNLIYK